MRIGIVLLLDEKIGVKVKAVSAILNEKFPCFFKLDSAHIPHLTLLHADIRDNDLEKVLHDIENLANSNKRINLTLQDLRSGVAAKTLIGAYFKDNDDILSLRQQILNKINKYLVNISPFLNLHITITRLKRDEDIENALAEAEGLLLHDKYIFPSIGICKIGENGTCTSVIKSMLLLSS